MKIGDKVRILPRDGRPEDYAFTYTDKMCAFSGKIATIIDIGRGCAAFRSIPDDGNLYKLDIDGHRYNWASSMLSICKGNGTISEIQEVLEVKPEKEDQRYEINFNL